MKGHRSFDRRFRLDVYSTDVQLTVYGIFKHTVRAVMGECPRAGIRSKNRIQIFGVCLKYSNIRILMSITLHRVSQNNPMC